METIFTIKDGQITAKNKMRKFFEEHEQGTYLLVSKPIKRRSLSQNAYFHSVVLDYVLHGLRDLGFDEIRTKEDAKLLVKYKFLRKQITNKETGEVIEYIQETHKLTKSEMMEFIENIQRWAAEYLGVVIPSPSEQLAAF